MSDLKWPLPCVLRINLCFSRPRQVAGTFCLCVLAMLWQVWAQGWAWTSHDWQGQTMFGSCSLFPNARPGRFSTGVGFSFPTPLVILLLWNPTQQVSNFPLAVRVPFWSANTGLWPASAQLMVLRAPPFHHLQLHEPHWALCLSV